MLSPRFAGIFVALLLTASAAHAAPDFYGVKMKSEDFAHNVFLIDPQAPDFSNNRPGTDKRIYAFGYMSSVLGGGRGIAIEVFNHSDKPIATEKLFRELTIVTYAGQRYDRSETEMMWKRDRLGPGERAVFNFKYPGLRVEKDEVRMVLCSFDLGETLIILFPLKKEAPAPKAEKKASRLFDFMKWREEKTRTPEPAPKPVKKRVKKIVEKKVMKPVKASDSGKKEHDEHKPGIAEQCVTPVKLVQSFFRGMGDRLSGKKPPVPPAAKEAAFREAAAKKEPQKFEEVTVKEEVWEEIWVTPEPAKKAENADPADKKVPPSYPLVKQEQVIEGVRYQFRPDFRREVQAAQQQVEKTVYQDRAWSLDNPDGLFTHEEATPFMGGFPRREAKVMVVNRDYGFVVVNAGLEQGFGKNVILNVIRNGRRIGKVMITKPREKMAGAVILPEWRTRHEIRPGDIVGVAE